MNTPQIMTPIVQSITEIQTIINKLGTEVSKLSTADYNVKLHRDLTITIYLKDSNTTPTKIVEITSSGPTYLLDSEKISKLKTLVDSIYQVEVLTELTSYGQKVREYKEKLKTKDQ